MNNLDPQTLFLLSQCTYLEIAQVTELSGKQYIQMIQLVSSC